MPITKSAIKEVRKIKRRTIKNKAVKKSLKEGIKDFNKKIAAKNLANAKDKMVELIPVLDKAAKRNIIHKNKASRLKSRLMKKINTALGKPVLLESKKGKPKKTVIKKSKTATAKKSKKS